MADARISLAFMRRVIRMPIPVVVTTNGTRPRLLNYVMESLSDNMRSNRGFRFFMSCDRCDDDSVADMKWALDRLGVEYEIVSDGSWSGAINRSLDLAYQMSDVAFVTEDDWILEKPVELDVYYDILVHDDSLASIRFSAPECGYDIGETTYGDLVVLSGGCGWMFNNHPKLVHRRIYDIIGMYSEPRSGAERRMRNAFLRFHRSSADSSCAHVATFSEFECGKLDDPSLMFTHAGKSTMGHRYKVPERYRHLNNMAS